MSNYQIREREKPDNTEVFRLEKNSVFFQKSLDKKCTALVLSFAIGVSRKPLSYSYPQSFPPFPQVFCSKEERNCGKLLPKVENHFLSHGFQTKGNEKKKRV